MGVLQSARNVVASLRRDEEAVHDFLGVVEIDHELGVLVLRDHAAMVLDVSGTDFMYAKPATQLQIYNGWLSVLNRTGIPIQTFVMVRPARWDVPGGFLDTLERQVRASRDGDPDDWQLSRLAKWRSSLLGRDLEAVTAVSELRQYIVIRVPMGLSEQVAVGGGEPPLYSPRPATWKLWQRTSFLFADDGGRDRWRKRRMAAVEALLDAARRLTDDLGRIPGLRARACSGLELTQLLHLLWRDEAAYDEWIAGPDELHEITSHDIALGAAADDEEEMTA